MATVTGLTAPRMLEIEANSVVEGTVDENGHLKLTTHGGEVIDAGKVRGDKGEPGGVGPAGPASPPNPEPIATTGLSVTSNTAYHTPAGQPMSTVVFTWTIPTLDLIGDIPAIDLYELWYRLPGATESTLLTASETNTATVTDLQPGEEVRVKVRAHSFQGSWGAFSSEIPVIPAVPSSSVPQEPGSAIITSNVGVFRSDGRAEANLTFTWDDVTESLDYEPIGIRSYEIWLTVDGATSPLMSTPETSVLLTFPSGVEVSLKVRAISNFGVWGDFSENDVVTTAFPAQVNTAATIPVLTTNLGVIYSHWDGELVTGPFGAYFQHLITEIGESSTGPWTAIGIPAVSSGQTAVIPSTPGEDVWVRFRWRDKLGRLASGISPVASITAIGIGKVDLSEDLATAVESLETAVISVITEYAVNASESTAPVSGWSTATPARTPGTFIWMRTNTEYADSNIVTSSPVLLTGNTGAPGSTGSTGATGKGISSTAVTYQVHTNGTTAPTGTWLASPAVTSPGQFLWTRTITTYTDATSTTAYSVAAHGANGTNGVPGVGVSSTSVTYQVHSSGTIAPTGSWLSSPAATATGQFLWTRTITTYTDASNSTAYSVAAHGATGATGATGAAGKGISSTVVTYQVHTSGTVVPTGTWVASPPATTVGKFLWTRTTITYTDASTVPAYSVSAHGATGSTGGTGAAGKGVASVTPYYLQQGTGVAAPAAPTTNPPGGSWSITEPGYLSSTEMYRAELFVFTDATFGWTSVSKISAYTAATQAMTVANLADAAAHGMVKASQTDPGHSVGRIWLVLDASNQCIGIKISNGSAWTSYVLMADQILVPSSVGTVSIADGAVLASKLQADEIWADEAWLNVLRAGVIEASMVTSSFGSELTLESNMAINTIITNQANTSIELDSLSAEIANSNADISGLSNDLGTVEGTAEAAKTAAEAAAALAVANQTQLAQTQTWFRVDSAGAHVGRSDSPFQTHILPNKFSITDNGLETSWWEAGRMVVPVMEATKQIVIARHQIEPFPSVGPTGTVIRSIS